MQEKNTFGYAIANLTIRINCEPGTVQYQIEKRWMEEPLVTAVERLLKQLFDNTQQAKAFNQISIARLDYSIPLFKVRTDRREN